MRRMGAQDLQRHRARQALPRRGATGQEAGACATTPSSASTTPTPSSPTTATTSTMPTGSTRRTTTSAPWITNCVSPRSRWRHKQPVRIWRGSPTVGSAGDAAVGHAADGAVHRSPCGGHGRARGTARVPDTALALQDRDEANVAVHERPPTRSHAAKRRSSSSPSTRRN